MKFKRLLLSYCGAGVKIYRLYKGDILQNESVKTCRIFSYGKVEDFENSGWETH